MSLKVKLISCISLFMLMLGVLIIGVFAATQQQINMQGSLSFVVPDKSLYVKEVRYQEAGGEEIVVESFTPGYINGNFNMDLTFLNDLTNSHGSFSLYFDIINTTNIEWEITNVDLGELPSDVEEKHSGRVYVGTTTEETLITQDTPIDGTLVLTIIAPNSDSIDLGEIVVTIGEYIDGVLQVTSVSSSGATNDTYSNLIGKRAIDGSIDLSGITFETTLTISMTSLSANYIKNKVSWVNTSGVTISSTSLYLSQNPSEELTSGTSKDLTITVNNTGSATQISGLEVEFEEKEDLLQVTEEGEVSEYTEEGYWYVEMGTYSTTSDNAEGKRESEYLRWRYFAEEETPYNADTETAPVAYHYEFDRNTRPTGEGYFILESYYSSYSVSPNSNEGGLCVSFNNDYTYRSYADATHNFNGWNNIDADDYSTSNIRQYINGNTVYKGCLGSYNSTGTPNQYGAQSNMFTDLHIDPDNDIIYTDIIGRTLGDLYTDMSNSTTNPQDVDFPKGSPDDWTGATITYSREDTDKFWLLSYYEAYHLLGADTTGSDTDRSWGYSYWLRSNDRSCYRAYDVSMTGYFNTNTINLSSSARAAFKLSI